MTSLFVWKFGAGNQYLFFLFTYKMLAIRAGNHKMLARIANSEDTDQTASTEGSSLTWDSAVCQAFREDKQCFIP